MVAGSSRSTRYDEEDRRTGNGEEESRSQEICRKEKGLGIIQEEGGEEKIDGYFRYSNIQHGLHGDR